MPDPESAARAWADQLAAWAIPAEILDRAPQSPWLLPVRLFAAADPESDAPVPPAPSDQLAGEALPAGGSVLDVGCGGGRAAFALVPPAGLVIGVDEKAEMLGSFAATATARGVPHRELQGRWPELAAQVPVADVVVCHHVAFNVPDLGPFALELARHATRRVVLELPQRHPMSRLSPLWQRFWQLDRPAGPTAQDALDVLRAAGLPARLQLWQDPRPPRDAVLTLPEQAEIARIRLCLTPDRDPEVARALAELGALQPREMATIWWDA